MLQTPIGFGFAGVDVFFVLSGFLLALPFARHALGAGPRPRLGRYFRRRLLRVFPAYYAQLAILSYTAGETGQAKLAEQRALELAPASKRKLIKAQLAAQKAQIDSAKKKQAEQQAQPTPGLGG